MVLRVVLQLLLGTCLLGYLVFGYKVSFVLDLLGKQLSLCVRQLLILPEPFVKYISFKVLLNLLDISFEFFSLYVAKKLLHQSTLFSLEVEIRFVHHLEVRLGRHCIRSSVLVRASLTNTRALHYLLLLQRRRCILL